MEKPRKSPLDLLVDWHFDQIDAEDREWLERELQVDPSLDERHQALGRLLRNLDADSILAPPANLSDKVIRYVQAHESSSEAPPVRLTAPVERSAGPRLMFSLRDVLAAAACIALFFGLAMPGLERWGSHAKRVRCMDHFRMIYEGLGSYSHAFAGALPRAGGPEKASWLYSTPYGVEHASNSRHPYRLVALGFVGSAEAFVCPSSERRPEPLLDPERREDFPSPSHFTYASLNMAGATPRLHDRPDMAYMSDANPIFINGVFRESVNPNNTNSPSHDEGKGQNVLKFDGSVEWMASPFRTKRDNLWIEGARHDYKGTEAQQTLDDAFLIPATPASTFSMRLPFRAAEPGT